MHPAAQTLRATTVAAIHLRVAMPA
eukprot:SAG31_NODE_9583_length_1256_cov_1.094209_1_plen_24_part_10